VPVVAGVMMMGVMMAIGMMNGDQFDLAIGTGRLRSRQIKRAGLGRRGRKHCRRRNRAMRMRVI